ncbi:MAG: AraC family transcriptional regulator [Christensenellales bacterium]
MEDTAVPYELPEAENHSFFFIDQRVEPSLEAKLHRHDAWELYYVVHGRGRRMAGDTLQPFAAGDVALIPPSMLHRWEYAPGSADKDGCVRYLMVAFSHSLIERCMEAFPELRNRLAGVAFPTDALRFGPESSRAIRKALSEMNGSDELGRLSAMLRLLPVIFTSSDRAFAGKPMRIERDVRRMQQICAYVMKHYVHPIALDDIAAEVGMNRSAFCSCFKRCKGMTFSQFVTQYRLNTACELLKHSQKNVSEICCMVGFSDLPHFVRVFTRTMGVSPSRYRKRFRAVASVYR